MPAIPSKYSWAAESDPISKHTAGVGGSILFMWPQLFFAALALIFACIGFFVPAREGPMVGLIVGVIGVAIAIGMVAWGIVHSSSLIKEVRLYDDGVMWLEAGRWLGARWEEIEDVYRVDLKVNGTTSVKNVTLKTRSRKQAVFQHVLSRYEKMANEIQVQTTQRMVPAARDAYLEGETLNFGAVSISHEGITIEKKLVAYDEIKSIDMGNGSIIVNLEGKRGGCKCATFGEIANYMTFLKLLEESPAPEPRIHGRR